MHISIFRDRSGDREHLLVQSGNPAKARLGVAFEGHVGRILQRIHPPKDAVFELGHSL